MAWVGDGMFDEACNVYECVFDNLDDVAGPVDVDERIMAHLWMWAFKVEAKFQGSFIQ